MGYYLIKDKYKDIFLLLASLFFYFWGEKQNAVIIIVSILINYFSGLVVEHFRETRMKKIALILSVMLNIGVLFYYKYTGFFVDSINKVIGTNFSVRTIILDRKSVV